MERTQCQMQKWKPTVPRELPIQGVSHLSCGIVIQEKQANLFYFNKYIGKIFLLWQSHPTSTIPAPIRLLKLSPFWGEVGRENFPEIVNVKHQTKGILLPQFSHGLYTEFTHYCEVLGNNVFPTCQYSPNIPQRSSLFTNFCQVSPLCVTICDYL